MPAGAAVALRPWSGGPLVPLPWLGLLLLSSVVLALPPLISCSSLAVLLAAAPQAAKQLHVFFPVLALPGRSPTVCLACLAVWTSSTTMMAPIWDH